MTIDKRWLDALRVGFYPMPVHDDESVAEAVARAAAHVEEHLRTSREVRRYLEDMPKGRGTSCPDSHIDELVRYVASQNGAIDKSDPHVNRRFMMDVIQPVFELERDAMTMALRTNADLSADERQLFFECQDLARETDALWAVWFEQVASPYQSLAEKERDTYRTEAGAILAQFDYTVPVMADGRMKDRLPWAYAFPFKVARIGAVLAKLEKTPLPGLAPYFAALRHAFFCNEIDKLEEAWTRVDEAWIAIPRTSRFIPVHGIESQYEHPFGVSPEFRLEVRLPDAADMITATMAATIAEARASGLDEALIRLLETKLAATDILVSVTAVRAGVSLNFRYAGQAGPNRQAVLARGGRIFIDRSSPPIKTRMYREKIARACEPETAHLLAPLITDATQLDGTASHECSHPVGRTPESDEALGEARSLCEEAKATIFGICAAEGNDPSPHNRLVLIANMVGRVLRFLEAGNLSDLTVAPYSRENLAAATMLLETGVILLTPEGLRLDRARAESDAWFTQLRAFCQSVISAYEIHSAPSLRMLAERYCSQDHIQVAALIAHVNRAA